jgi:hypothetical protein
MSTTGHGSYSAPPQLLSFDGLLFDFDGTIIDSTDGMWTSLEAPVVEADLGTSNC